MQPKKTHLYILVFIILTNFTLVQESETVTSFKLLTAQTSFEAGSEIVLKFVGSNTSKPLLYCSNSYGSTLVSGALKSNTIEYVIPKNISKKTGVVTWKLINDNALLIGEFTISTKQDVESIETYLGPQNIQSGGINFAMLVVIPTDYLDNPMADSTLVKAKYQFLTSQENTAIYTKHFIAHKKIYSKKQSGKMLVSSESLNTNSKEFTVNITAGIPLDFDIYATRPHVYADGNQITTFSTSVLIDKQNNIVGDGTYVTFIVTTQKGYILKTAGTTIDGVAKAKIIHPDFEDNWSIKAYVDGISESNTIALKYKQVIKDFDVTFLEKNRTITVGPLKSFMQQIIPDGLQVTLLIYKDGSLVDTLNKTAYKGFVTFNLKAAIYQKGNYNFSIKTAGKTKNFNTIKLW